MATDQTMAEEVSTMAALMATDDVIVSTVKESSGSDDVNIDAFLNGTFGTLMTLLTFTGQVIVFVVVSRDPRLRTPSNYFIISLALADMMISILSMTTWTVYSTLGRWPLSQALCDFWNCLDYVLCMVSIYTILFMSVDRYLSLKFPFTYRVKRTPKRAKMALALIWIGTTIVYGLYIEMSQLLLGHDRDPDQCSTYYLTSIPLTFIMVTFAHWTGVFGTAIFYVLVFRIAKAAGRVNKSFKEGEKDKSQKEKTANQVSTVSLSTDVSLEDVSVETTSSSMTNGSKTRVKKPSTQTKKGSRKASKEDKESKAMKTIALLLVTFAVCWLPLSFVFAMEALKPGYLNQWWMIGGYWLGYVNSMLNPVCYAVGNPNFRETLWKLLSCGRRSLSSAGR